MEERTFRHKIFRSLWRVRLNELWFKAADNVWKRALIMSIPEITRNPTTYQMLSKLETKLLSGEVENE